MTSVTPPIRYEPSVETPEKDEAETSQGLNSTLHDILEKTSQDYGYAVRSVHAKSHALLEGTLSIPALPPELAQGLFATPGEHKVVLRISTIPGDILNDSISVPRGLAIKVLDVTGERLPAPRAIRRRTSSSSTAPPLPRPKPRRSSAT